MFDVGEDPERTRDLSYSRPGAAAWLYQELSRAVNHDESRESWSTALRELSLRQ